MDINEECGLLRRGIDRRLAVKPEIVAQPDDIDAFAHGVPGVAISAILDR